MSVVATYRGLLRNPALTRLLVGEFVSSIGDWLYLVALLIVVYEESQSAVALGIIGAARILPYVLLSVPAGIAADRFDRRKILIATDVARGVVMLALAVLVFLDGPLPIFVGLSILAACFSAFFGPAIGSLLPSLVKDEAELGPANSAWATLDNLATVIGPAVGGVLIAAGGLPLAFLLNAVSFGLIAAILIRLPRPRAPVEQKAEASAATEPGAAAVRKALTPLTGLAMLDVVAAFVFGGLGILTVVIAADVLGDAQATTGYLNGALGFGGLIGALASGVLVVGRRLGLPLLAGGLVLGACLALLGQVGSLLPVLALLTIASAGSLLQDVVSTTIFQRSVPDAVRGRALGVLSTVNIASYAAGSFTVPIVVPFLGLGTTLLLSGIAISVATVGGFLLLGRAATEAKPLDTTRARLLKVPIFAGLPPARLEAAAHRAAVVEVTAGEAVIRQGEEADRFYIIVTGRFPVTQVPSGKRRARVLRTLGPDEMFGEIGLLTGVPRTATVTAETDGVLLALDAPAFLELVSAGPGLTSTLLDLHRGASAIAG